MANKKDLWVTQHSKGGWQSKREGSDRALGVFDTQKEAIDFSINRAKEEKVEVIVQGRDGKIRSKDSYGNDPNPPKDKEH